MGSSSSSHNRVIDADKSLFLDAYNKRSFAVRHTLATSGLFALERIAEIGRRILEGSNKDYFTAIDFKGVAFGDNFGDGKRAGQLATAIERLGEAGTWIKLTRAQDLDDDYRDVVESITNDLESLAGRRLREEITRSTLTVFLASPGTATPFHIDHESNFLLQIHGTKDVCVFDPEDRELVPDEDIERFYGGHVAAARYRQEMQDRGTVYRISPGDGVHHPPLAPHWVKNGEDISISVSVNFCMRQLERRARIYQANFLLRKAGLHPASPGQHPLRDKAKAAILSAIEKRHPTTYKDLVFSPMVRIRAPLKLAKRVVRPGATKAAG